jgi:hypothetical protein
MSKLQLQAPVMTDEQKHRVLNALMWMQVSVYMCDNTENIPWFHAKRVKYLSKNLVEAVMKDHGHIIKALWDDEGTQMHMVTRVVDDFCQKIQQVPYWKLTEVNHLLDIYLRGDFDHLFTNTLQPTTKT